ncbi:bZIP transcription factor [Aspergillus ibericus CBS 121593]|uniref:BZIP domain-containing protein n=1 Tax=Aspergillus ibericus CBS 121593 TaxID=1448316 RepID=A0A395H8A4_9EURO|nr:hypothetical protein BO80DRAFT_486478 [Aspergillus ibericus CBS 121593]RAL04137.1 hypothetical protein BO80DRAFT_486478 [Aspergillus ibericus CBS 121593]
MITSSTCIPSRPSHMHHTIDTAADRLSMVHPHCTARMTRTKCTDYHPHSITIIRPRQASYCHAHPSTTHARPCTTYANLRCITSPRSIASHRQPQSIPIPPSNTMSNSSLSSAEKKRLRDRRAQQTLRNKKQQYITQLEEQVAHCERYHDDSSTQHLLQVIEGLQRQNEILRKRQEGLKAIVESWESPPPPPPPPIQLATITTTSISKPNITPSPSPTESLWSLPPLHSDLPSAPSLTWLTLPPHLITTSPPSPHPLDLLYGTHTNPLAHAIHTTSLRRPLRDPERLAFGWLSYHYVKWLFAPSPTTFALLPTFLHPVPEQHSIPHPACLDLIVWPEVRVTLIREWGTYAGAKEDLFGFLACCLKVRWPWGEAVLERDEGNELVMRGEFRERFMVREGWGITREFVRWFPGVVKGVELGEVVVEVG